MFQVIFGVLLLIVAAVLLTGMGTGNLRGLIRVPTGLVVLVFSLFMFGTTSYVHVDSNEVLHLKKIYGGASLTEGKIIAADGEKGYQANVLSPGFHVSPLIRVINDVEHFSIVEVPAGFYGRLTTKDGVPLPAGAIMAEPWSDEEFGKMLDASHFLKNGGQKGLQASVLKPGKYRMNLYLFKVEIGTGEKKRVYDQSGYQEITSKLDTRVTEVPAGHVAVIKSNLTRSGVVCVEKEVAAARVPGALSAPLVPKGCKGIWKDPLFPGAYFLNRDAYQATLVDTRVQTWQYQGGYEKRKIDLTVSMDGSIEQSVSSQRVEFDPARHADKAVFVKVEGWDVPQELRAIVQIAPKNAPIVVASVGGLSQVEDRVLTPAIRSIVRNVIGSTITYEADVPVLDADGNPTGETEKRTITRATAVLDLIENRGVLEDNIETLVALEGRKAGVEIKEVRFGEPAIPPELLVARQREQLSKQLAKSFIEERKSQDERIKTEQAKATAEQQPELVKAQIAVQVSEQYKKERLNRGNADRQYLEQLAEGQSAQAKVLGEDRVMTLQLAEKVLAALSDTPELVGLVGKLVPHTVVMGDGDGLSGPAAILSSMMGGGDTAKVKVAPKLKP